MPFTAQPGQVLSRPGNIVPGFGANFLHVTVFGGIIPSTVGDIYDIAIGYPDPITTNVTMVGYVIPNQGQWQESTNLQDEQHIVQIASPLSTDRYGRFPKVSQGDWTHGEGQLVFTDAQKYYLAYGADTTKPGHLTCLGATSIVNSDALNGADTSTSHWQPSASNHTGWVLAWKNGGNNALAATAGLAGAARALAGGGAIGSIIAIPGTSQGAALAGATYVLALEAGGIYLYDGNNTTALIGTDIVATSVPQAMAYFGGFVYYIEENAAKHYQIKRIGVGGGAGTVQYTTNSYESHLTGIASTANGLVFVSQASVNSFGGQAILYTFDGTTATRVADFPGWIMAMYEMNGVTFLLASMPTGYTGQANVAQPVLYSLTGSTVSLVSDFRYAAPDFQAYMVSVSTPDAWGLSGDGRFLYIGVPGWAGTMLYDTVNNAFSRVDWVPGTPSYAGGGHQAFGLTGSTIDVRSDHVGGFSVQSQSRPSGGLSTAQLVTSFFDFGTPLVRKVFTSIEFIMNSAVDTTAVTAYWQTDSQASTTPLTTVYNATNTSLICYLPRGTTGSRVRFQVNLNAGATQGAPDLQAYSVSAKLTRVWQVTVACRREQKVRADIDDPQNLTSSQLLANIRNAYDLADGQVFLWVPDPSIDQAALDAGRGVSLGVAQVVASLQDYKWTLHTGVAPGFRQEPGEGVQAVEGDVELVLSA